MFILLSLTFLFTLFPNTCHVTLCKIISCDRIQTYLTLLRHLSYHLMKTDFVTLWRGIMWPYSYETHHFTYQMLLYTFSLVCVCVERGGGAGTRLARDSWSFFFFSILYSGAQQQKSSDFFWNYFCFGLVLLLDTYLGHEIYRQTSRCIFWCHRLVDDQLPLCHLSEN